MKRGVRRLIVKLTLCTLAGAVVTWGVAWGCAISGGTAGSFGVREVVGAISDGISGWFTTAGVEYGWPLPCIEHLEPGFVRGKGEWVARVDLNHRGPNILDHSLRLGRQRTARSGRAAGSGGGLRVRSAAGAACQGAVCCVRV